MVNRPKQIGTAAETAVLKQVRHYFPEASRNALAGHADLGDIGHCGLFVFEVKAGKQTKQIGDGLLAEWMGQAATEARNAEVARARVGIDAHMYGVLVVQRWGFGAPNARRWWVYVGLEDFAEICGGYYKPGRFSTIRLELGDFLDLISDQGFVPNVSTDTDSVLVIDAPQTHDEVVPMIDWLGDSAADRLDEELDESGAAQG